MTQRIEQGLSLRSPGKSPPLLIVFCFAWPNLAPHTPSVKNNSGYIRGGPQANRALSDLLASFHLEKLLLSHFHSSLQTEATSTCQPPPPPLSKTKHCLMGTSLLLTGAHPSNTSYSTIELGGETCLLSFKSKNSVEVCLFIKSLVIPNITTVLQRSDL